MGLDGTPSSPNQYVARDAYGVTLHYNRNDYTNILSTCYCISGPASALGSTFRDLYNGNITGMSVNIPKINYPVANPAVYLGTMYYNYKYDQLNRIKAMDAYTNFLGASQSWNAIVSLDDYKERVSYDANGNILTYLRRGTTLNSKPLNMDSLSYKYYAGTNQLRQVRDSVHAANYTEDIDDQSDTSSYVYDAIGNLIKDKAEGIDSITWNVYGKIMSIRKSSGLNIWYTYDAGGSRISKKVKQGSDSTFTWYARDATGNVLSVYRIKNDTTYQDELHLYGSSRIGMIRPERNLILAKQYGDTSGTLSLVGVWRGNVYRRGQKFFELANHLGNVLVTISDKKLGIDNNSDSTVDYYMPDVATANDYYPFGMGMPERKFSATGSYRYGFNGKENDNEVKGEGNQQDYGMRIYDPRLGRFLSVDPITKNYPWYTPYQFAGNKPIWAVDLDGAEELPYYWQMKERSIKNNAKTPEDWARIAQQEKRGRNIVVGTFLGIITFGYGTTFLTCATASTTTTTAVSTATILSNPANQLIISSTAGFIFTLLNPDPNGAPVDFPGIGDEFAKGVKWLLKTKAGKQVEFIAEAGSKFANKSEYNWTTRLLDEGNNVKLLKESTEDGAKSADLMLNGIKTEIKEISGIVSQRMTDKMKTTIELAAKQAGKGGNVIIDVTKQAGATKETMQGILERLKGTVKEPFNYRIVGEGFELNGKIIKNN